MANLFVNLPLPALNGPGAAVSTAAMGSPKTIVVAGTFPGATITVEASTDGGTVFAPVPGGIFTDGDSEIVIPLAAEFMRVNVQNRKTSLPFAANIDVGANDNGAQFAIVTLPAGNGAGPSINVSALGYEWTFVAGGSFPGASIVLEVSEDGVGFAPIALFAGQGGLRNVIVTGDFVRANVKGRKATIPFTATLSGGAIDAASSGPGGLLDVEDEGVSIGAGPFTILNFAGSGVTATDSGGGTALITIPGAPPATVDFQEEGVAVVSSGTANFVGAGATVTNVAGVATITIPGGIAGVAWQEEAAPVVTSAIANFVGGGATVTNVAGVATVTIPGVAWQDEGGAIVTSAIANFVGAGVAVTNVAGVATVTIGGGITGVAWQEEGAAVVTAAVANFVGTGVTVTDVAGVATVTVAAGGPAYVSEQWAQNDVVASQTDVALETQISTNFATFKTIRAGSIVGMITRLSETCTAGQLTVDVQINGATVGANMQVITTNASNQNGGTDLANAGVVAYAAGDLIGVVITTNAGWLPVTADLEVSLQVVETL